MGARWHISTKPTDGTTQPRQHGPESLTPTSTTTNRRNVIPRSLPPNRKPRAHSGASGGHLATATPHLYRTEDRKHGVGRKKDDEQAADSHTARDRYWAGRCAGRRGRHHSTS